MKDGRILLGQTSYSGGRKIERGRGNEKIAGFRRREVIFVDISGEITRPGKPRPSKRTENIRRKQPSTAETKYERTRYVLCRRRWNEPPSARDFGVQFRPL